MVKISYKSESECTSQHVEWLVIHWIVKLLGAARHPLAGCYLVPWRGKITFTLVSCDISELRWPLELCFGHGTTLYCPRIGFKKFFKMLNCVRVLPQPSPLVTIFPPPLLSNANLDSRLTCVCLCFRVRVMGLSKDARLAITMTLWSMPAPYGKQPLGLM